MFKGVSLIAEGEGIWPVQFLTSEQNDSSHMDFVAAAQFCRDCTLYCIISLKEHLFSFGEVFDLPVIPSFFIFLIRNNDSRTIGLSHMLSSSDVFSNVWL